MMKSAIAVLAMVTLMAAGSVSEAAVKLFSADINTEQATPEPVIDTPLPAFGAGVFKLDESTNEFSWDILVVDFLLQAGETASMIHGPAAAGINAGVLITLGIGQTKIGSANLADVATATGFTVEQLVEQVTTDQWYVNVHTSKNPSGEIRGQIKFFPEPTALGLCGLAGVGVLARRRRR